jgi:glycerophosphoryl diester phosphodiesterase
MVTAFLDGPGPLAFAHRGGAAHAPENSWRAFEHAVGLGYRYLETDLQATADGVLVAFHDRTLKRVCGRDGRVSRIGYTDLCRALVAGTDPIPRLEDLLVAWPDVRFNLDVKDAAAIGPLPEVLRRTNAWSRVCVVSFSASRLRATRRALGRPVCMAASPVGTAMVRFGGPNPDALTGWLARNGVHCVQVPASLATRPFLRRAHALGLQVHAWTVNDRATMERLLDRGVDGIMTDQTVALRDVLAARSQWHPRPAGS